VTFSTHTAGNYNKLNLAVHVRGGKTVKLPILAEAGGLLRTSTRPMLNRSTESSLLYERPP